MADIHELRLLGSWIQADLSAIVSDVPPATPAAGGPFAYITPDGVPRVIYRGTDNHIHELRLQGSWIQADLSAIVSDAPPATPAAGDPFAYITSDGVPRVVYQAQQIVNPAITLRELPDEGALFIEVDGSGFTPNQTVQLAYDISSGSGPIEHQIGDLSLTSDGGGGFVQTIQSNVFNISDVQAQATDVASGKKASASI